MYDVAGGEVSFFCVSGLKNGLCWLMEKLLIKGIV